MAGTRQADWRACCISRLVMVRLSSDLWRWKTNKPLSLTAALCPAAPGAGPLMHECSVCIQFVVCLYQG